MYRTLFELTSLALVGWLLPIALPRWSVTRRLGESEVLPAYLAVLYLLGVAPVLVRIGPGLVRAIADPAAATRLLAVPELALLAWIHILTFDQVVGLLIYRDNMRHGWVSMRTQSVLLVVTLVLGPVGYLAYWALRLPRRSEGAAGSAGLRRARARVASRFAGEPLLLRTATGILGLGLFLAALLAVNGRTIPPHGDLVRALGFAAGLAGYVLTLAMLAGPAALDGATGRHWRRTVVAVAVLAAAIETVQSLRGLTPRFPVSGGAADRSVAALLLADVAGLLALFGALAARFYTGRDRGGPLLRAAIRYAAGGAVAGLLGGGFLAITGGATVPPAGTFLPLHLLGLAAAAAVPAVAGLFRLAETPDRAALPWLHAAGLGWLGACAAVAWQAGLGEAPLAATAANALAALALGTWLLAAGQALLAWRIRARWETRVDSASPNAGPPEPALELLEPAEAGETVAIPN